MSVSRKFSLKQFNWVQFGRPVVRKISQTVTACQWQWIESGIYNANYSRSLSSERKNALEKHFEIKTVEWERLVRWESDLVPSKGHMSLVVTSERRKDSGGEVRPSDTALWSDMWLMEGCRIMSERNKVKGYIHRRLAASGTPVHKSRTKATLCVATDTSQQRWEWSPAILYTRTVTSSVRFTKWFAVFL